MAAISILIVDDHAIVRQGLRLLLESHPTLHVIGEASDIPTAINLAQSLTPDVILLDLLMPHINGVEGIERFQALGLTSRILVLSSSVEDHLIKQALQAGAHGYILKASPPADLIRAIEVVASGGSPIDPGVGQALLRQVRQQDPLEALTNREQEIFRALASGLSNPDIADKLMISEGTVRTHIASVLDKLQLRDRTQVTIYALKRGLIQIEDLT